MKPNILLIVFSLVQLIGGQSIHASGPSIGIDTTPDDSSRITSKIVFSSPSCVALFVLRDRAFIGGGFTSPIFSFGAFQKQGLLRLINQPLGFSAGSEMYYEKTRFRLNTAVLEDPCRQVILTPLPDVLSLFASECRNGEWNAGGYLRLSLPKIIQSEIIFTTAAIPLPSTEQTWLLDGFQYPGGGLQHMGVKVSSTINRFFIFMAGGLSLSETVLPGGFILSSVGANFDSFHWAAVCGFQSDGYVSPDGHCPPERFTLGTTLDWKPINWISFHPSLSYSRNKMAWYDVSGSSEKMKCSLATKLQAIFSPIVSAHFDISFAFTGEKEGDSNISHLSISCQTKWQLTPFHLLQLSYTIKGLDEDWTHNISLKHESRFGRVTAAAQVTYDLGRHEIEMAICGEIKKNDYCMTLKTSGAANDDLTALVKPFSLTLAFSYAM